MLSDVVSHRLSGTPLGHAPLAPLGIINQSSQAANIKSQVNTSQVVCDGVWAQDQCATRSPISVQPSGNPLSRASKRRTATTSENVYDKRCTAIGTVFRPQLLRQCEATPTMLRHNEVMKSATKHIAKGGHKWGPCEPIPSSPVCPCPLPGTGRGSTPDAGPRTPSSASSAAASPNDLQLIPCHPPEPAAAAEGQATPATSPQPAPGRPSRDAAAAAAALSSGCHRCPAPRPEDPRAHTMGNDNPCRHPNKTDEEPQLPKATHSPKDMSLATSAILQPMALDRQHSATNCPHARAASAAAAAARPPRSWPTPAARRCSDAKPSRGSGP